MVYDGHVNAELLEDGKGKDHPVNCRAFAKYDALRQELSWTHYRILALVEDEALRQRYIRECAQSGWNTRIQRAVYTFGNGSDCVDWRITLKCLPQHHQ